MGEMDAANSQGAMDKLPGGDNIETLFFKVFISINFLQVRGEMTSVRDITAIKSLTYPCLQLASLSCHRTSAS